MTETVTNLTDLTGGRESGIVLYGETGIICNWTQINGLPKMFATGLIGLGETITVVEGTREALDALLNGVTLENWGNCSDDDIAALPTISGTVYRLADGVIVIAPDGWC